MKVFSKYLRISFFLFSIVLTGFNVPPPSEESQAIEDIHIIEPPLVSYPLPVVDYIENNGDAIKKRSINDNPIAYILRGNNDIWKGTSDSYQSASSGDGPGIDDYEEGNPIIDSVIWRENIQYVINVTHNRTDEEAILAFLDENRAKYYSVIDGFGPLTEDYVKYSGAYVDLPQVTCEQVLENTHYQCSYNDNSIFAGNENSTLGAVVRLARDFRNMHASTSGTKYLYATPRPWRMNDDGVVNFSGTTYDTITQKPTYSCIDHNGVERFKIFDIYESNVKIVPGLICSRRNHNIIYNDNNPSAQDLYSNTTENRRKDNAYPSGHTNAGFLPALAYAYAFPERFSELVYRGSQLGESRIVAGMHSPVDVIAGKTMALSIACAALNQSNIASDAERAVSAMYDFFVTKADNANLSVYEYAHSKVDSTTGYINGDLVNVEVFNNNYYDDREMIKKIYRSRLTYGFPQDSTKAGQAPIVPKGVEVILKSRFPYLTDNQRRAVLYTTEIPSGYKIIDKTNGWGRIDLLSAADGYGSFIDSVSVNMNASLGRFNALDTWGNDIDGVGSLIKQGTGKLILTGNNSYSGGTQIVNGILATASISALGSGNVTLEDKGILEIINPLHIKGELKLTGGTILAHVDSNNTAQITVDDITKLENSALVITFDESLQVKSGDQFVIIQADTILGDFSNITANNYNIATKITENALYIVVIDIPAFISGASSIDGTTVALTFDSEIADPSAETASFAITYDGTAIAVSSVTLDASNLKVVVLTLASAIAKGGSELKVVYTPGTLKGSTGGVVEAFGPVAVTNNVVASVNEDNVMFSVYPNPCTDKLQISGTQIINGINIINIIGQVVHFESGLNTNTYTIEMSDLNEGIYYISVEYAGSTSFNKIVKK